MKLHIYKEAAMCKEVRVETRPEIAVKPKIQTKSGKDVIFYKRNKKKLFSYIGFKFQNYSI